MVGSRIEKSMKNAIFSAGGMMAMFVISFVSKSIFIKELGNAFNGVNYLFTGILNALNLAELGFASAIAYALYKPLATGDHELAAVLMNLFKRVYRIVALIVAVIGTFCIPFLQHLIKEDISTLPFSLGELRIYYAIYLLNDVLSYLLAYKRTIITADQQSYIISAVDYSCNIVLNILQIVLLVVTKSYYAFLVIMLAKTVINNIIIAVIANKKYPYIKQYKNAHLLSEDKKKLFGNVRAMMLHKIGAVVIINTSTIVVSAVVGVMENSLYGNYTMIAMQVMAFINIIFSAVTASVGNLCAEEIIEKQVQVFENMNYLSLWIGYFVFVCYVCLFNPFIDIWLGQGMTFGMATVVMFSVNQCVSYVRKSVNTFKDAKGLFRPDRYKPLIESAVGISLAIGLGHLWGVFGIMLGYTLATVCIAVPVEQWVLFRKGFNISGKKYVIEMLVMVALTGVVATGMYFLLGLLPNGIGWFVLRLLLCLTIPNIVFVLLTFKTPEFKYFWSVGMSMLGKVKNKLKHKSVTASEVGAVSDNNSQEQPISNENQGIK